MPSLNKVTLIGHLGADPEARNFQGGGKVVNLRIATSESWKDKSTGERKERTEWHSVAVFAEHAAKYAETYLRKGALVYLEGKLETRKWQDQSGTDRYTTEITIRPFGGELMGMDKPDGDRQERREERQEQRQESSGYGAGGRPDMDDEIPFAPEFR